MWPTVGRLALVVLQHAVCPLVAGLATLAGARWPEVAREVAEVAFRPFVS